MYPYDTPRYAQKITLFVATLAVFTQFSCANTSILKPEVEINKYVSAQVAEFPIPPAPATTTSDHITVAEFLTYADTHSPLITIANAEVEAQKGEMLQAETIFPENPTSSISAGPIFSSLGTGVAIEAEVSQTFEIAGERQHRKEVVAANIALAKSNRNFQRWQVHVEVHRLILRLILAKQEYELAETFSQFSKSLLDIVERQIAAGESSPHTLLVSKADYASAQQDLLEAKATIEAISLQLTTISGWKGPLPEIKEKLPAVQKTQDIQSFTKKMIEHHPDYRTHELAVVARQKELELANASIFPKPTVGFSYELESMPKEDPEHTLMLNLTIPISLWQTNQGERARAAANLNIADQQRDLFATQQEARLIEATSKMNAAASMVLLYEESIVPYLSTNLEKLQRAFEIGEVDIHQVTQTKERLLEAISKYLKAKITYYDSAATVEGYIGTEFWHPYTEN